MTIQEFSATFDTLLNSYNTLAMFGEAASKADLVLDEYEKSVLLTLAQDIIVKSYFDRSLNPTGQGYDDSSRRLMDFSSLITTAKANRVLASNITLGNLFVVVNKVLSKNYDLTDYISSIVIRVPKVNSDDILKHSYTINSPKVILRLTFKESYSYLIPEIEDLHIENWCYPENSGMFDVINSLSYFYYNIDGGEGCPTLYLSNCTIRIDNQTFTGIVEFSLNGNPGNKDLLNFLSDLNIPDEEPDSPDYYLDITICNSFTVETFDARGVVFEIPKNVLLLLNEKVICSDKDGTVFGKVINNRPFTVVPINYKEYDRLMSKAYTQPLRKLAWRLFNNSSEEFTKCEIIPIAGYTIDSYVIRYIRRPDPIILVNLKGDGLDIDGKTTAQTCKLNPIIHIDILNKAVELALNTRGRTPKESPSKRQSED